MLTASMARSVYFTMHLRGGDPGIPRRADVSRDLVEGGVPRPAAAAPHVDVWVPPGHVAHQLAELHRVTRLEVPERAQRNLVPQGGNGSQASHPREPGARLHGRHELRGVRAVDAVERGPVIPG